MELVSVFKFSLYALTALAAWILGRAEEGWVPYATLPVLLIAYLVTETRGGRTLSAGWANLFGALAVAAAGLEFSTPGPESKLLAGAHLLIYATWIVMFQEKTYRLYWWVMALGVLQVAVASVLQPGPWYGVSLLCYVCAALATMSIAALYQVQQQFATGDAGWRWREQLHDVTAAEAVLVRPAVQYDESHQWLTRRFFGGLVLLIGLSLGVSAGFFTLTPRIWFGPRNIFGDEMLSAPNRRPSSTGFAREVRLGEMGEILESVNPVFSIRCLDALTGEAVSLQTVAERMGNDEPLFRGTVMTEYAKGRWFPERNDQPVKVGRVFNRPGYAQEVVLEPTADEILFCVGSPQAVEISGPREDAYLQLSTGVLSRERRSDQRSRLSYTAYVAPLPLALVELHATPMPQGLLSRSIESGYLSRNAFFDATQLPHVQELALKRQNELKQKLGRTPTDLELAEDFQFLLRDSGEFGYTLSLSIKDPTIDPVEDFLLNRREGHCEYFASTLTLMLRAVGVPARLVSGFKGAELNGLRGTWEVQERFAHAWTEVWSEEHELWLTFDATPAAARSESVETVSAKLGLWGRLRSSTTTIWQDYVVNVSLRQQQDRVYGPMREFFDKVVATVRRLTSSWQTLWSSVVYVITHPSEWFSVTGGIVTFVLLASLAILGRGLLILLRWIRASGWIKWLAKSGQPQLMVAFYERFVRLTKPLGLQRRRTETPEEFALQVQNRLQSLAVSPGLVELPLHISRALYRVRYGGEILPAAELQDLELQLSALETALQPAKG